MSPITAKNDSQPAGVWFVYDGDCPICAAAAQALRVKQAVGELRLVNARDEKNHPIVVEVNQRNLDLDEGMVIKYRGELYHGRDALHFMALFGSNRGWFNRLNAILFRSKTMARLCYPTMREARNLLLRLKGVPKLRNLDGLNSAQPIFQAVFKQQFEQLPQVFKRHYAVRPYSHDVVAVHGSLNVRVSFFVGLLSRLFGVLVPYSGDNIPVTVRLLGGPHSGGFRFEREFRYPNNKIIRFSSCMERLKDNELVERMRLGFGWRLAYEWSGGKILLLHRGYVWRILGIDIPVPLEFVLGRGYAEEEALSDNEFRMQTYTRHPLFGHTFGYDGRFKVLEVSCPVRS